MKSELLYIFIGGGTGSVLRYTIQVLLQERIIPSSFPWATFTVNVLGSFLIGVFYSLSSHLNLPAETRLLLTTGLCGGFTTFSTFSYDNLLLWKQGHCTILLFYISGSLLLGIAAVFLGAFSAENAFFLRKT